MVEPWGTVRCALFAHKGGSFGIRELRQSDSNTTVREMKLGGTVVISLILCFVSRNKAQVSLIFFHFFVFTLAFAVLLHKRPLLQFKKKCCQACPPKY